MDSIIECEYTVLAPSSTYRDTTRSETSLCRLILLTKCHLLLTRAFLRPNVVAHQLYCSRSAQLRGSGSRVDCSSGHGETIRWVGNICCTCCNAFQGGYCLRARSAASGTTYRLATATMISTWCIKHPHPTFSRSVRRRRSLELDATVVIAFIIIINRRHFSCRDALTSSAEQFKREAGLCCNGTIALLRDACSGRSPGS